MNWAVWGLPLVILLLGLVVGAVIVLRLKGSSGNDQQDLQETKDALLDQLRQLNVDRARMNAVEFQQRRELLLEAAATTLREMDNPTASDVGQETGTSAATSPSTPMQKMGWSAVALCITGGLVWLVVLAAQPRGDGSLTGASIGGEDPMAAIVAAREERMAGATAALEANPQDMNALNVLTYEALLVRDLELAMEYMETSREIDPDHPEVMVHLAILQMSAMAIPLVIVVTLVASRYVQLVPDHLVRRSVFIVLIVAGIFLILTSVLPNFR